MYTKVFLFSIGIVLGDLMSYYVLSIPISIAATLKILFLFAVFAYINKDFIMARDMQKIKEENNLLKKQLEEVKKESSDGKTIDFFKV